MGAPQWLQRLGGSDRVGHQLGNVYALIANLVHKRAVGAVFQQAAHQIGQQSFVRADGGINAAGTRKLASGRIAHHFFVQAFAHAVQALKLVLAAVVVVARHVVDAGQRLRVVGGKLRKDGFGRAQQFAGTGEVGHIGMHLAGEDRKIFQPIDLRALDFAVPVRAFDQAHHQAVLAAAGQINDPVQHKEGAALVGLHHKANAVPASQRGGKTQLLQQIQRNFQPVCLFGVNVQANVVLAGQLGQLEQARVQLTHHAFALGAAVARVQGRQLDGDARAFVDAAPLRGLADGVDGLLVRLQVAQRIFLGGGRFAQHVVGVAETFFLQFAAVGQRSANGLAGDELLAHHAHGGVDALPNQRLAPFGDDAGEGAAQLLLAVHTDQLAGNHQAPGGSVDEQGGRVGVRLPVAFADFVADQGIARGTVGNAQQGLGQAHQRHAFLAGQRILLHQRLNPGSFFVAFVAQGLYQARGQGLYTLGVGAGGRRDEQRQAFGFGAAVSGGDGGAQHALGLYVLRQCVKRCVRQRLVGQ